jgi:DivIVA domain-containing protein
MSPDGQAQARAVYVVQRTFRLVRRGYDPAEVDRHLELVNEWFTTSGPGREARELKALLAQREQAVAALEARAREFEHNGRLEADATLEGARLRAESDRAAAERAAADARTAADQILSEAHAAAETIRAQARRQAEEDREQLLATSRTEAEQLARQRHEQAENEAAAYVKRRQREIDRLVARERDRPPA